MSDSQPVTEQHRTTTLRVRRTPKYVTFLVLGAVLGVIAAFLVTFLPTEVPQVAGQRYDRSAVLGFFLVAFLFIGAAAGGLVALLLDWWGRRHSHEAQFTESNQPEKNAVD